ncbi:BRR2 Pre-mRNA-splicing helicase BRR2 [Candida maltosa Xu316]
MSSQVIRQRKNGRVEEETPAMSVAGKLSVKDMGSNYRPEKAPKPTEKRDSEQTNDQAFEIFMTKIRGYLPDSSHEVIISASEVGSEELANPDLSVPEKRKELENLLNVEINDTDLNDLISLANSISVHNLESEEKEDDVVAVEFESSDDEQNEIAQEIDVEEDDDEEQQQEDDEIVPSVSSTQSVYDWEWLSQLPDISDNSELNSRQLDNDLNELLDYEYSDVVIKCIENRWRIVFTKKMTTDDKDTVIKEMEELELFSLIPELFKKRSHNDDNDAEEGETKRHKKSKGVPQKISLEKIIFSTSVENTKVTLPEGTYQENKKSYDIITVPPPVQPEISENEILPTSVLPTWAQEAFPSNETTTFNRIQSKIYPQAFETDNNLLICAPTGAGKTNVAMLTILRTIGNFRKNDHIQLKNFKIVYIAPLKALVQEQMREFQRRLTASYGVVVNELTGDSSLTKQQILETQIIVTTPEKWDIITRKDPEYVKLVKLVIIDEIHLLHDERGPVLESIVSRIVRKNEQSSNDDDVRIVGLSATLPNYQDVAKFTRVEPDGLFYFDSSYRPCPLQQEFVGVKETKAIKKIAAMNEACFDRMQKSLAGGHQLIIFVHSRKETHTTAKYLLSKLESEIIDHEGTKEILRQESELVSNSKLKEILAGGFGIHHAGLNKKDRSSVEDLFAQGHLRVLVSTATLAWGVNLPAHTVIIKGTETYSPETGTWVQLSPQDILQMLGRAGRPRYDKNGEGIIITSQDEIQYYLAILNQQLPIESQLIHKLVDNVNAEIVSGSITTIEEGIEWLGYSYFFVRMLQSPSLYGVEADYDFKNDPTLYNRRADLIYTALLLLHENKLIVYDPPSGSVKSTELGRIASYFYINYETINLYGKMLKPWHNDIEVLRVFANSGEFKYIPVRQEERFEISKLMEKCPIPIKEAPNEPVAKINILLQTYISRLSLEGYALISDMIYITQSAGRLLRALYEIALLSKWSSLAKTILNLSKMVEQRMWLNNSPLRQFGNLVPDTVIKATEMSHLPWTKYFQLSAEELAEALNLRGNAKLTKEYIESFPRIFIQYDVHPIDNRFLRVQVEATPSWNWVPSVQKYQELFHVFLEDCNGNKLLHHEQLAVKKHNVNKPHIIEFFVSLEEPVEPNYMLSVVSDKWIQCSWKSPIVLKDLIIPKSTTFFLDNSSVELVSTEEFGDVFPFTHFNKLQSACFDSIYKSDENVFVGSPKGDGKTVLAELAIIKHWNDNGGRVVYINPCQQIIDKLYKKWTNSLSSFEKEINKLTGVGKDDLSIINGSHLILATPEQFDTVSKRWKTRKSFRSIDLIIPDDLHLIGSNVTYEMLLSRIHMMTSQWEDYSLRVVGLSSPILNCRDVADWLGISKSEIYNFPSQSRQNTINEIKLTVDDQDNHVKMFKELSKLNTGLKKSVVFCSTYKKAVELAQLTMQRMESEDWRKVDLLKLNKYISKVQDPVLKELLAKGIALYYTGMSRVDQLIVERLFELNSLGVLYCTKDTCQFAPSGDNVMIVGTSYYEGYEHRYIDYTLNEIFEMIGCCHNDGTVHIYTSQQMVDFYGGFIDLGLPVESLLPNALHEFFINGIGNGIIRERQNCIDLLTFTFFYKRLLKNASFYDLKEVSNNAVSEYLSDVIENVLEDLIKEEFVEESEETFQPLNKLVITTHYGSTYETITKLGNLTNKSKLKDIFEAVTSASEFGELVMREGEETILTKLQNKLPIKSSGDDYDSPYFKAFILVQAHISRVNLPFDLKQDQQFVLSKILTIINACIDVLSSNGYLNALVAMDLSQMIVQAVWGSDNPLKQIPQFNKEILARCVEHKVETVYDIMSLEDDERDQILQLDDNELNEVAGFVNQFPNVEIKYELTGDVITNESKKLTVIIDRDEEMESLEVVKNSNYPITKEESWWIVIGDSNSRVLFGVKKVNIDKESQSFDIDFSIPNSGKHDLTIYLVCDSYLDADKEMSLVVDVK